ncbi:MAG: hypothetical protein ABS76_29985 [Pelagibacterium sp. SCN 64-44]|nr:MAG: hypothetical protein ABS76_29985 [Pelagibacterium sp. SCN 64-44]
MVEDLVPPRAQPRPAPRPVAPAAPTPADQRPNAADEEPAAIEEEAPPPLPRPRPEEAEPEVEAPAAAEEPDAAPPTEPEAPAMPQPDRIYQTACPALLSGRVVGEMLPPIAEGICGERSPLSLTGLNVNGRNIALTSPVTTNCAMAGALADWAEAVDAYAKAALDNPVASLTTGTSMLCRNRNGGDEGFVSEHGFANALDVVGFTLADGRSMAVAADWLPASAPEGRFLRQAHGAACGLFTTVLGPEANAAHEDHLHVDLGCHGRTCTAQICE